MLGFNKPLEHGLKLKNSDEIESKYYLRLKVSDEPGVLAQISKLFEQNSISIAAMLQKNIDKHHANLLFSTHLSVERDIQRVLTQIEALDFVASAPVMIRIV
jgi:homoserine dehydrogenase